MKYKSKWGLIGINKTKLKKIYSKNRLCDLKGIIEVKDYLYDGNLIYGTKYEEGEWILEDGNIFSLFSLMEDGCKIRAITPKELIEEGKYQATKDILEEVIKKIDIPVDTEEYKSETDLIYDIVDACDSLVKELKQKLKKLGEEKE